MIDDAIFDKTMALATGSMPGASAQLSYNTAQQQLAQRDDMWDDQQTANLWSGIGNMAGGYLSMADSNNSLNPFDWF